MSTGPWFHVPPPLPPRRDIVHCGIEEQRGDDGQIYEIDLYGVCKRFFEPFYVTVHGVSRPPFRSPFNLDILVLHHSPADILSGLGRRYRNHTEFKRRYEYNDRGMRQFEFADARSAYYENGREARRTYMHIALPDEYVHLVKAGDVLLLSGHTVIEAAFVDGQIREFGQTNTVFGQDSCPMFYPDAIELVKDFPAVSRADFYNLAQLAHDQQLIEMSDSAISESTAVTVQNNAVALVGAVPKSVLDQHISKNIRVFKLYGRRRQICWLFFRLFLMNTKERQMFAKHSHYLHFPHASFKMMIAMALLNILVSEDENSKLPRFALSLVVAAGWLVARTIDFTITLARNSLKRSAIANIPV